MSKRPWMPLYVGDYRLGTLDLTLEQHGAYLLLLMLAWRRPDGKIPDDENWIRANLPPMHGRTFNHVVRPILARFFTLEGGQYYNKRLLNEIENTSKRSRNATENVSKRWARTKENKDLADTAVILSHSHSHSHSQSKNIDIEGSKRKSRKAKTSIPLPEGWCPPPRATTLANSLKVDLQEIEARFRDYLASNGKQYVDYDAAFCNFIRNAPKFNGFKNGLSGPRQLQDDKLSVSRAADRLIDATREGKLTFGPRPSLVPDGGESNIRFLPKR
jgi:uncharacterized protein YdaU (DUF1376 family)